jgi:hypothetical protein
LRSIFNQIDKIGRKSIRFSFAVKVKRFCNVLISKQVVYIKAYYCLQGVHQFWLNKTFSFGATSCLDSSLGWGSVSRSSERVFEFYAE